MLSPADTKQVALTLVARERHKSMRTNLEKERWNVTAVDLLNVLGCLMNGNTMWDVMYSEWISEFSEDAVYDPIDGGCTDAVTTTYRLVLQVLDDELNERQLDERRIGNYKLLAAFAIL